MRQRAGRAGGRRVSPGWTSLLLAIGLACGEPPPEGLAGAASAYLRAHAEDPVPWRRYGPAAFAEARALDRPLLVVSGYATCHWCRVLGEESWSDPELGAWLAARTVPVLVDREEQPEVDQALLELVRAGRPGPIGWPLLVLLRPEGAPIAVSGYRPLRDGERGVKVGLASWLAEQVGRPGDPAWAARQQARLAGVRPGRALDPAAVERVRERYLALGDPVGGGRRGAPRFPLGLPLQLLLSGGPEAQALALVTLEALASSPLRDPLQGGFYRYATDEAWQRPHFERRLDDQVRLLEAYLDGFAATGRHRGVIEGLVGFLLDHLCQAEGCWTGFDAASPGPDGRLEEGAFAKFTPEEVRALDLPEAEALIRWFELDRDPELPPVHVLDGPAEVPPDLRPGLDRLRRSRPPPAADTLVTTAGTARAAAVLARAGVALGRPEWVVAAERLGEVAFAIGLDPELRRGRTSAPPLLDDAAGLLEAAVELLLATGSLPWAARADRAWGEALRFEDGRGGFWRAAPRPDLPAGLPHQEGPDGSPAGRLLAARQRLATLRGEALEVGPKVTALLPDPPEAAPGLVEAWVQVSGPRVAVWVLGPAGPARDRLVAAAREGFDPARVVWVSEEAPPWASLAGKGPGAWVCTRAGCAPVAQEPDQVRRWVADYTTWPKVQTGGAP